MAGTQNPDSISFDPPIEDVGGNPLPNDSILKYQYGITQTQGGQPTTTVDMTDFVPNSTDTQTSPFSILGDVDFGQWYGSIRTVMKPEFGGLMSEWSAEVPFEIVGQEPNPPTNLTFFLAEPDPEPEPSLGDVTTFAVEGTGSRFVSFAHPFAVGTIPTGQVPVITSTSDVTVTGAQTQVLATHADGSVRHAMLHGTVTGGQTFKIRTASAVTGTNKTVADFLAAVSGSIARVLITGTITGTCDLRDLLSSATNRAVMTQNATNNLRILEAGPNVLMVRVAQNVGTHLRVNFEVRWYGGTVYWVDVFVVNGYSTLNGMDAANYTGEVEINGSVVTTQAFTTTNHFNHTAWHPSQEGYWSGTAVSLYVKHNTQYIQDMGAVPNYRRTQVPTNTYLNTLPVTCAAMDNCQMRDNLDDSGAGDELALLPRWCANYIKSGGDVRAFRNMLANDNGGAAYPVFFLNHNNGEFMTENEFPNASYNQEIGFGSGMFTGQGPFGLTSVNSHLPSVGYVSYLVTGSQFYLDLMNAWTSEANLWNSTNRNRTFSGRTVRQHYEQSIRGMAWQYRTNGHSAYINPDNHFLKPQWNAWVNGVATVVDVPHYGTGGDRRNALGGLYEGDAGTENYALFFHLFFAQATAWLALDLGFSSLLPVAQYAGILVAGLFGSTGEFPFEVAPRDRIVLGTTDGLAAPEDAVFFDTFAEVRTANNIPAAESGTMAMAAIADSLGDDHSGARNQTFRQTIDDSYFANFLPALSYLHRLGISGGMECWVRSTLSTIQPDFSNKGQWDIGPREVTLPAYIRNATPLTWTQIPNTVLPTPDNYPGDPDARITAWGGMSVRWLNSDVYICAGGGHGDASGNSVERLRLNATTPAWVIERQPTLPPGPADEAYFTDGRPNSRHIYHDQQVHQGLNRVICHGASFAWSSGFNFNSVSAYSIPLQDWLPSNTYPDSPGSPGAGMKAYNLASGCIYFLDAGTNGMAFRRWSPNTGTVDINPNTFEFGTIYKGGACDPIRGNVLHTRGAEDTVWRNFSIDNGAFTSRNPETTPGLSAPHQALLTQSAASLEWDIRGKRFIYYVAGQEAFAIDPVTYAATPLNIQGTPPPDSTPNGLFSRCRYVPELDIMVVLSNPDQNVYFFKFASTQRPMP